MKAITAAKAREKMAEAEQALAKRSFFKAAPDYFTAESTFKQAAMQQIAQCFARYRATDNVQQTTCSRQHAADNVLQESWNA